MKIKFTPHALLKFRILEEHNFFLSENDVLDAINNPDRIMPGRKGRKVAQRILDETHTLRVIYEEKSGYVEIVTFYPARRNRYEN